MNLDRLLIVANEAVDLAAAMLTNSTAGQLTEKADRDFATEVDYAIEIALRDHLARHSPDIGFLGEEYGHLNPERDRYWVLDPIDGTVNYSRRLPLCGISLALIEDNRPILGIIDHTFLGARYHATRHGGATKNGTPIQASTTSTLAQAVVSIGDYAVGDNAGPKNEQRLRITATLAQQVLRIRMFGATIFDLAWLAEGRTDASITLSNKPWDTAAGVIIAQESGATVTDLDGNPHTTTSAHTIATGPRLNQPILELLAPPAQQP